ncbi:hypothetical protein E3Q23_04136 [Wallemia mellicola]|uniref:Carbonic anhydrase n=1 Tax=Wallemia mellicola TaxID=1708541 RepID=A0A4T0LED4_9BASI|nr:hypothetical protein E3Q24_04043 [Wallemia mellicola]TIB70537.1 hypothetical protein E3Q23_04136 [Wallemia mellicola]TIC62029.1 carbonic anhydrase [Wallemia mellicola]
MSGITKLLTKNQQWSKQVNPDVLKKASEGQWPSVLWIGCSDSRCSEASILESELGEVFTHRNIANQFNKNDFNAKSVVDFAINHLKIKEVALCGHTSCGGMAASKAVLEGGQADPNSPITQWLSPFITHCSQLKKEMSIEEITLENINYNKKNLVEYINNDKIIVKGLLFNIKSGEIQEI